ncbi:MAG: LysR substrate-binding domain-containing protein [Rhodospirillaceae bacterium]|nr:LysR substrate-binding domain-containing protein [Rhodospirillaceae bacterium]
MTRHLPLTHLRVFESASRTGSFRSAATELNLSPSAVSHAIRKLECIVGTTLFERSGRTARLTQDGEALMNHIGRAFEDMRRGLEVISKKGPGSLRLHCAPSFATQWLSPRLSQFLALYPDIEMRLSAGTDYTRFLSDDFDADIIYGQPREGLVVLPLGEEVLTPLCSPAIAAEINTPRDLYQHVLIESEVVPVRWATWFAANGLVAPPPHGMRFDRSFLAIAAAADGLGVALESTLLAEKELSAGRIVAPLAGRAQDVRYQGHFMVCPKPADKRRPVQHFARWLAKELGVDPGPFA